MIVKGDDDFAVSTQAGLRELSLEETELVSGGLSAAATGGVGAGAMVVGAAALAMSFPFSGAIGIGLLIGGAINFGVGALGVVGGGGGKVVRTQ